MLATIKAVATELGRAFSNATVSTDCRIFEAGRSGELKAPPQQKRFMSPSRLRRRKEKDEFDSGALAECSTLVFALDGVLQR